VSPEHLEVTFIGRYVEQIFIHADSLRSYLVAVIVPNFAVLVQDEPTLLSPSSSSQSLSTPSLEEANSKEKESNLLSDSEKDAVLSNPKTKELILKEIREVF